MSIDDLMSAVRSGEFEEEFKKCKTTEEKVNLFKKYGVIVSLEQYKSIESKVAFIKQGSKASYDELQDKVECNNKAGKMDESEFDYVSGGVDLNAREEQTVFEILKRMEYSPETGDGENSNVDDMKLWEPLQGRRIL